MLGGRQSLQRVRGTVSVTLSLGLDPVPPFPPPTSPDKLALATWNRPMKQSCNSGGQRAEGGRFIQWLQWEEGQINRFGDLTQPKSALRVLS